MAVSLSSRAPPRPGSGWESAGSAHRRDAAPPLAWNTTAVRTCFAAPLGWIEDDSDKGERCIGRSVGVVKWNLVMGIGIP